jgi:hypothetical protein
MLRCDVTSIETKGWLFRRARFVGLRISLDELGEATGPVLSSSRKEAVVETAVRRNREQRAREACMDGLRVLSYIAFADDALTDEDLNMEASYVEARLAMHGFDHDHALVEAMISIAQSLVVPKRSFVRAVNAVAQDEGHYGLVCAVAKQMVVANGQRNQAEAAKRLFSARAR